MKLPAILFPLFKPILLQLDPERAHNLTLTLLRLWQPLGRQKTPDTLRIKCFDLEFPSPIGLAAGFDKNGIVADKMAALGFGFVEIGTLTPQPQKGNPRPRLFRIPKDQAILNRMGFNNQGISALTQRSFQYLTGINIGVNAHSSDHIQDYITCLEQIAQRQEPPAYITINVSSPNTKNLRQLEEVEQLTKLLDRLKTTSPLLVKLSPDMEDSAYRDIAALAIEKNVSGLIAVNTTIKHNYTQKGGLSGAPLRKRSTHITSLLYQAVQGKIPIIGVGGISSGTHAYQRIRAGASLVQLYSALVWHGPALITRINQELAARLAQDGFSSLAQAVGTGHNAQNNQRGNTI